MTDAAYTRASSLLKSRDDAEQARTAASARAGERLAATLGDLKGAAMKVGQMASMAKEMLPPQFGDALTKLQSDAPPMPYEVIRTQLERELGEAPERLFESFDPEPFAAASIGQVHRARTDGGREVVCKVQYPGVDRCVDSDLANLRLALRAAGLLRVSREAADRLFEEIRDGLREEVDYTNEADNVRLFSQMYADDDSIVVPEVIGERSSGRVLTLSYEPGDPLAGLVDDPRYPQESRDAIGARLFRLCYEQCFGFGVMHGDPNPANFAFRPSGQVVLYDFGNVKRFTDPWLAAYRNHILELCNGDFEAAQAYRVRFGGAPRDAPVVTEFYSVLARFIAAMRAQGLIDTAESDLHHMFLEIIPVVSRHPKWFPPEPNDILFQRVNTGLWWNMRAIGAVIPMWDLISEFLALPQLGDEGWAGRSAI